MLKKQPSHRFISNLKSPIEFLNILFIDEILEHICEKTGRLYFDKISKKLRPDQLRLFIGLELMRGFIGIRNMKMMWGTFEEIEIKYPGKENALTKNHWFSISNNLNFDPKWVHSKLVEAFKLHLIPGYHVTIDEIRIPCTNESCPYKNHNRDKPDIWAIESKSLHAQNGYLVDFINPCQDQVPTPRDSVFQFATWLKTTSRHHHLVMDSNFVSSLDLLKLSDLGFEATVSCRSDRPSFIWKNGLAHKLPKSYSRVASSKRLVCVCTNNRGVPKIASTLCIAKESQGSFDVKERRELLSIYDKYKGKADQFGQLYKSQYPSSRHQNWLCTLLFGWFYFALTNAFILYNMRFDNLTHRQFVYKIAKELLIK
jgi:hypothetical protein